MPEPNEKDPKEKTAAELAASYGKGGQGKPKAAPPEKPAQDTDAKAKADAEARARADLAIIAKTPQLFVHGVTALKGADDNDIIVLNDLEGRHISTLIIPKRVSKGIVESLG